MNISDLAAEVCRRCWACGALAVLLIGQRVTFTEPEQADVSDPRFVGVFNEDCGNREVADALRYTQRQLEVMA